ncbi:MAG: ABC transporter substrate-binding protein, partial [Dehalococcoidia bacterium]
MSRKTTIGLFVCLVLLLIAMPLIACGPGAPAKEKVLRIAWGWDMTGPASSTALPAVKAATSYTRWLNEEKGGIEGIRVELLWADTGYKADRAVAAYTSFKEQGVLATSQMAAHSVEAVKGMAERDQIPITNISPSFKTMVPTPHPWAFSPLPMIGDGFTAFMIWLKQQGKTPAKVAILGWDSPYGRMAEETAQRFAREYDIEVVEIQRISPAATEATSQLTAMARANPDYIFHTTVAAPAAMILKEAKRLGIWPRIQMVGNHWDIAEETLPLAGDAVEGAIGVHPVALWAEEFPAINLAKQLQQRYQGAVLPQTGYLIGTTNIRFMWAAVEDALKEVGFDNLDGAAVKAALEKFQDRDLGGIIPSVTLTADDHRGPRERIIQVQKGKRV